MPVPNFLVYGAFLRKWAAKFRGFQVFDFLYYTLIWYAVRYNILLSLPFNPDVTQHHPTTNASILAPHPSWQHPTFQPYPPHVRRQGPHLPVFADRPRPGGSHAPRGFGWRYGRVDSQCRPAQRGPSPHWGTRFSEAVAQHGPHRRVNVQSKMPGRAS